MNIVEIEQLEVLIGKLKVICAAHYHKTQKLWSYNEFFAVTDVLSVDICDVPDMVNKTKIKSIFYTYQDRDADDIYDNGYRELNFPLEDMHLYQGEYENTD